jgi:hypothetical protein
MVERGYEGAASTDHDQQAQAVGLFLTDSLLEIWPSGSLSQSSEILHSPGQVAWRPSSFMTRNPIICAASPRFQPYHPGVVLQPTWFVWSF